MIVRIFHNPVFPFLEIKGLNFVCLFMDFVLKLVTACLQYRTGKGKKKQTDKFLCYNTNNTTQLSLPGIGSTMFNTLNVNLSLAITTYCHSYFMQYLYPTQPLQHERSHGLLYMNLLFICFSFFLKGKNC